MCDNSQINNATNITQEVTVCIDKVQDNRAFNFKNEQLTFERIIKKIINSDEPEGFSFGLFKIDGTQVGYSFCRADKFKGKAWYLDSIKIFPEFKRKGYGTQLLEKTCEALWQRKMADIFLERPSNKTASDGFDRKRWYERHGFKAHPNQEITFMLRTPSRLNKLMNVYYKEALSSVKRIFNCLFRL